MSVANKKEGSYLVPHKAKYPDMKLYEEILLLQFYFKGKWCVENVLSFYEPLIKPYEISGHYFWTNFIVTDFETGQTRGHDIGIRGLETRNRQEACVKKLCRTRSRKVYTRFGYQSDYSSKNYVLMKYLEQFVNKIIHGDCLEVMKSMPDKCVDLVLTDPPYGIGNLWVGGKGHGWGKSRDQGIIRNAWDNETPTKEVFDEIFRISKNQVIWGGNYFNLPVSRGWLIWNKPERGFSLAEAELAWTSRDMVIRVFDCHRSDTGRQHPTQKPLELMEWSLSFFPEAQIVFDPFAGSCTTAVACTNLKRKFICIEKEESYIKVCNERMNSLTQTMF